MVNIQICVGTSCHRNGAYNVLVSFQHMIEEHRLNGIVTLEAAFCMQQCAKKGVAIKVNGKPHRVTPEGARRFFRETVIPLVKEEQGA